MKNVEGMSGSYLLKLEYSDDFGEQCSDSRNPIGRTFLSGNRIFAETGKSRLSVKPRPVDGELHLVIVPCITFFNYRVNPIQIDFQFQEKFIGFLPHLLYT